MATTGDGGAAKATAKWREALARMLVERFGAEDGASLGRRYVPVLGSGYRGRYGPEVALRDVELTVALVGRDDEGGGGGPAAGAPTGEGAPPRGPLAMDLLRPPGADPRAFRFKLFHLGGPVHLSDSLPMLENMGLRVEDEHPRELPGREGGPPVWLHDFGLRQRPGSPPRTSTRRARRSRGASPGCGRARRRTTASTASPSPPASTGARSRCSAPTRSTSARSASA